jgi:hypothetical protein
MVEVTWRDWELYLADFNRYLNSFLFMAPADIGNLKMKQVLCIKD